MSRNRRTQIQLNWRTKVSSRHTLPPAIGTPSAVEPMLRSRQPDHSWQHGAGHMFKPYYSIDHSSPVFYAQVPVQFSRQAWHATSTIYYREASSLMAGVSQHALGAGSNDSPPSSGLQAGAPDDKLAGQKTAGFRLYPAGRSVLFVATTLSTLASLMKK